MRITLYVHGSKESAYEAGEKAGIKGDALELFKFTGGEHRIEYEVNPETGDSVPVKIDGRSIIGEPVKGAVPDWLRERMAPSEKPEPGNGT